MDIKNITNNIDFNDIVSKIDESKTKNFENILNNAKDSSDMKELKKACQDFESVFVNMLLKSMRGTVVDSELTKKSHAREIFEGMLDEEISKKVSQSDSVGIAKVLYDNLKDQVSSFDKKG